MIQKCRKSISLAIACALLSAILAACSSPVPASGTEAASEPLTTNPPIVSETPKPSPANTPQAEDLELPMTVDWNGSLVQVTALTRQALPVLDEARILSTLHTARVAEGVMQTVYRARDAEQPEFDHFSYLEVNGVKYDLGKINHGEDSYYASGENALKEMGCAFTRVIGLQDAEVYTQVKSLGMKCNLTLFYEIADQVPYVLGGEATGGVSNPGELMNVLTLSVMPDGTVTAIATDYGSLESDMYLYRFDCRSMELRTLSLKALLRCDEVTFFWDEIRQEWAYDRYGALRYPEDWRERGWGWDWRQDQDVTLMGVFTYENGVLKPDQSLKMPADDSLASPVPTTTSSSDQLFVITSPISASAETYLAVKSDGTLIGWGTNDWYTLGDDGGVVSYETPVEIMGGVRHASAGQWVALMIDNEDTLWGNGMGYFGQLMAYTSTQEGGRLSTSLLSPYYAEWAKTNGYRPLSNRPFVGDLRRRFEIKPGMVRKAT